MKRLNLSMQIALIFLAAFVLTYTFSTYMIINSLTSMFEANIFDQLESAVKELATSESLDSADTDAPFAYVSYSSETNIYNFTENITDFISREYSELLINKAAAQNTNIARYKNIIDEEEIYYVILNYDSFYGMQKNNIFIILTDSTLKKDMIHTVSIQILLACLFTYLLGYLLIYLWIGKLVSDTKNIAKTLFNTGKDYYKTKVTTKRHDEIGDLVSNIELMREKIVDNEKQKQEIIQGVSHDLKTPIAIIRSYAEALEDELYTGDEVSKITLKQCDRLNSKVKKLLLLTRIGYLEMNNPQFNKIDIEKSIMDTLKPYIGKSDIEIVTITEPCEYVGDPESWQIVMENLLDNALRYSKNRIVITQNKNSIKIFNDGEKIPEDEMSSIFNAYYKGLGGNYGLGLSIVKSTVNLFGYSISVRNTSGGVVFTIE